MSLSGDFTGIGVAPSIVAASFSNGFLKLTFSEGIDPVTSTVPGNYSVNGGVTVTRAEIDLSNSSVVFLTLTGFNPNTSYTLTISNVKDLAGNTIA